MKKLLFVSLMLLCSTSLWATKYPATLKLADGTEKTGEVNDFKIDDKDIKFYPADGGKTEKIASSSVAVMTLTFKSGNTADYEYVPVIGPMAILKKSGKLSNSAWLQVQMRGYMTLYHNRVEAQVTSMNSKGATMSPGSTTKFCRRAGEKGASAVLSTFSMGTNNYFKRLALVYFDDDEQIIEKITNETYTYKDIEAIVTEYNSRHEQ